MTMAFNPRFLAAPGRMPSLFGGRPLAGMPGSIVNPRRFSPDPTPEPLPPAEPPGPVSTPNADGCPLGSSRLCYAGVCACVDNRLYDRTTIYPDPTGGQGSAPPEPQPATRQAQMHPYRAPGSEPYQPITTGPPDPVPTPMTVCPEGQVFVTFEDGSGACIASDYYGARRGRGAQGPGR